MPALACTAHVVGSIVSLLQEN